ncbi:MAG: 4'-phosphopantetheinyl transferase family protein [Myxococcota bacterium]
MIEVWTAVPSSSERWLALLDEDERVRWGRLVQAADRDAFATAHGLLRQGLAELAGVPAAVRLSKGPNGKPFLEGSRWQFNLSHCRELVAVAFCAGRALGVDVEPVDPRHATDDVARRVYGPRELEDLARAGNRVERFYERWTLKEAWVKATGVGIDDDLPAFQLRIEPGRAFVESGDARPWQFHWWTQGAVKLAVCVAGAEPIVPRLTARAAPGA